MTTMTKASEHHTAAGSHEKFAVHMQVASGHHVHATEYAAEVCKLYAAPTKKV